MSFQVLCEVIITMSDILTNFVKVTWYLLCFFLLFNRDTDRKLSPSRYGFHFYLSVMPLYNSADEIKPDAGTFTDFFCGEEGFKDP